MKVFRKWSAFSKRGFNQSARGLIADAVQYVAQCREEINDATAGPDVQAFALDFGEELMEALNDDDGAKMTALLAAYRQQPDTFAIALCDCLAGPPPG